MQTRMYLTFDHLCERERSNLVQVLGKAIMCMPARWALEFHFALPDIEFVDLVPDPNDDHSKREDEPT